MHELYVELRALFEIHNDDPSSPVPLRTAPALACMACGLKVRWEDWPEHAAAHGWRPA